MLETTIWSQVVYSQGMQLLVFFTPVVVLDFVLYQELVIIYFCKLQFCAKYLEQNREMQ